MDEGCLIALRFLILVQHKHTQQTPTKTMSPNNSIETVLKSTKSNCSRIQSHSPTSLVEPISVTNVDTGVREGEVDGGEVGFADGVFVGDAEGDSFVGTLDGDRLGEELVGTLVGKEELGDLVGFREGIWDGETVGSSVVGLLDGKKVGFSVVGLLEGATVGLSVGKLEGS